MFFYVAIFFKHCVYVVFNMGPTGRRVVSLVNLCNYSCGFIGSQTYQWIQLSIQQVFTEHLCVTVCDTVN